MAFKNVSSFNTFCHVEDSCCDHPLFAGNSKLSSVSTPFFGLSCIGKKRASLQFQLGVSGSSLQGNLLSQLT